MFQEWDGVVLQNALQMLRCDPTRATGFAPAELMIGRPLVYPVEFSRSDIDLSGTTMTTPLVQKLRLIRQTNFTVASKKICSWLIHWISFWYNFAFEQNPDSELQIIMASHNGFELSVFFIAKNRMGCYASKSLLDNGMDH